MKDYPLMTVLIVALAGGMFTVITGELFNAAFIEQKPIVVACSIEVSDSTGNRSTFIGEGTLYE
jgi:hypothetical protein